GQSYKLFFKADNTIETIPYSNLKITSNITSLGTITTGQQFNVLLENGTQIIFGGGTNFIETTENNRKPDFSFTNSWVIQK
ncbi:hypothetical protein, partial [Enterobacter hormaechei]|uniref:hypothetical protein n=1 Tax=Enterobacter hormaechei TaxID=158836 RepID=UPI001952E859